MSFKTRAPWPLIMTAAACAMAGTAATAAANVGGGPPTPALAADASTFGESPPPAVTGDGRFVQKVPVRVPSFHGIAPAVGLVYDSRQGDGIAGRGWRLTGDSVVQRLARGRGAPRMDARDHFLLDGEKLIPCGTQQVKGPSCTTGGDYSTERETYRRIRREGEQWMVWETDGTRSTYAPLPGTAHNAVFALSEVRNTHGDAVEYRRWCPGGDACYLDEIEYLDANDPARRTRVEFHYEERPDPVTVGIGPAMLVAYHRLRTIEVRVGDKQQSALALEYAPAGSALGGKQSRLERVTRYGADVVLDKDGRVVSGTRLPAENFAWPKPDGGMQTPLRTPLTGDRIAAGAPGGAAYSDSTTPTGLAMNSAPDGNLPYYGDKRFLVADVNGDGRSDHISVLGGPYRAKAGLPLALQVRLSNGNGTFETVTPATTWPLTFEAVGTHGAAEASRLLVGDVDGDGRSDLVNVYADPATKLVMAEAALGGPSGTLTQQGAVAVSLMPGWNPRVRWFLGDHDGDGRDDLLNVHAVSGGTTAELAVALSDGARFGIPQFATTPWTWERQDDPHWFVGDVDGDRRADILGVESTQTGSGSMATLRLALSKGDRTFAMLTQPTTIPFESRIFTDGQIPPVTTVASGELAHTGDFDGDGRTDLLLVQPRMTADGPRVRLTTALYRYDGAFALESADTSIDPSWMNTWQRLRWDAPTSSTNRWLTTDLDGDGRTDVLLEGPAAGVEDKTAWPSTVRLKRILRVADPAPGASPWHVGPDEALPWLFQCENLYGHLKIRCTDDTLHDATTGDINGDGRGDFVYTGAQDSSLSTYAIRVHPSPDAFDPQLGKLADVDGDGREDWVYVQATGSGLTAYTGLTQVNGEMRVVRKELGAAAGFTGVDMRSWIVADFGSAAGGPDGKADLLHLSRDPASHELRYTLLLSAGLGAYAVVSDVALHGENDPNIRTFKAADVDGDGAADLVQVRPDGTTVLVTTLLADGRGGWRALPPAQVGVPWSLYGQARMQAADVDGDGLVDLIHAGVRILANGTREESVLTLFADGAGGWSAKGFAVGAPGAAVTAWQVAELNGDGRSDLVRVSYHKASQQLPGKTRADRLLSRGHGAFEADSVPLGIGDHAARWSPADLDGDGCDELVWVNGDWPGNPGFGSVRRIVNTCASLVAERTPLTTPAPTATAWTATDRNGDMTRQLVGIAPGGAETAPPDLVALPLGAAPRLIHQAFSGLGRRTALTYGSSAGSHDGVPPGTSIAVVKTRSESDGAPGGKVDTRYAYAGLRYSYALQRLLGFFAVDAVDARKHVRTLFASSPGCAGKESVMSVLTPGDKLLLQQRTIYAEHGGSAGPWTCEPAEVRRRECDGEQDCRELRTNQQHDAYGNVTEHEELGRYVDADHDGTDDTPDDNRVRRTGFEPNTGRYIVSLPAWTRTESGAHAVVAEQRVTYDANGSYLDPPQVGERHAVSDLEPHLGRYVDRRYHYDAHGNVTKRIDPTGRATTTTWDPTYGRFPESECNARWCTETVWDLVLGVPTDVKDPQGLTTSTKWDRLGRHLRTDHPDGGCLEHAYLDWGAGPPTQRIREDTCVVAGGDGSHGVLSRTYHFDGRHRVMRDDRSGGYTRNVDYVGDTTLVARESSWYGSGGPAFQTRYGYDALDRPLYELHQDKSVLEHRYGPGVERITDETSRSTTRRTDGLGRVTGVDDTGTGAPALTTELAYDALDQLVSSTAPTGVTTRDVGPLGWVWEECDPDRGCVTREFDDAGRTTAQSNAAGQRVEYAHETLGRLESTRYLEGGAVVDKAAWSYDTDPATHQPSGYSLGQVTQTYRASSLAREKRSYDRMGRITEERTCVATRCASIETTWDAGGRVARIRYPDRHGQLTAQSEEVVYDYDAAGRAESVGPYATDLTYTPSDQLAGLTYGNGVHETIDHDTDRGWTSRIEASGMAGNWPKVSIDLAHDVAGRITGEDRSSPVPYQKRYGYDAYGRLRDEAHLNETYSYDAEGRLSERSTLGAYVYGDPQHANAVTSAGNRTYTYDAAGRMASGPESSEHTWDADGNLTGFTGKDGRVTYGYDADGRRVYRDVPALRDKTIFAGPLVEIDGDGEPRRSYVVGNRLIARTFWRYGNGTLDQPAAIYYELDPRGSVSLVTDDAARPIQYYDYEPYGTAHMAQTGVRDELRFAGARQDDQSGLIHLGARDYDPAIGRFISPDSVLPDSLRSAAYDRYAYGYFDPVNTVDPSGHTPLSLEHEPLERHGIGFDGTTSSPSITSAPRAATLLDRGLRRPFLSDDEPEDGLQEGHWRMPADDREDPGATSDELIAKYGESVMRGVEPPAPTAWLQIYNDFAETRVRGHARFPGEKNSLARHYTVSYELTRRYGENLVRQAGWASEIQGFVWQDLFNLRGRFHGTPWAFSTNDMLVNEIGIKDAASGRLPIRFRVDPIPPVSPPGPAHPRGVEDLYERSWEAGFGR